MRFFAKTVTATLSAALIAGAAAPAQATPQQDAEQLRKLDIMLMVTALRCRHGGDNFQRDYDNFSIKHNVTMQGAARTLEASYNGKVGAKAARKQLDKISVSMANQYGQGHPWLQCAELKQIAQDLAAERDSSRLLMAAGQLLASDRPSRFALAR